MRGLRAAAPCLLAALLPLGAACDSEPTSAAPDVVIAGPSEAELLAGTWLRTHKAGKAEYEFRADGTYTQRVYATSTATAPDTTTDGTFSADDGVLTLSTPLSTEIGPYVRDGATFSREQVFRRSASSDGALGSWEYVRERNRRTAEGEPLSLDEKVEDRVVLAGDGSMKWTHRVSNGQGQTTEDVTRDGTWSEQGDLVTTQDPDQVLELKRVGDTLYDTRGSWLYLRQ